jgi:hypothetical protein
MYMTQRSGEEQWLLSERGVGRYIPTLYQNVTNESEEQRGDSSVRVLEGFRDIDEVGYRVRGGGRELQTTHGRVI